MLSDLLFRFRALFRRRTVEQELEEELQFHLDRQRQANLQSGLTPGEAMARARRAFGGLDQVKEECRQARGVSVFETLARDVRYACRSLWHSPGFATVAVLTLALGMGANTALFSVVHAVLLQPLPYPESGRLVRVWSTSGGPWERPPSALPDYRIWRSESQTFVDIGAYHNTTHSFTGGAAPERLSSARLTASLWSVLGTRPLVGDVFSPQAEQWGHHRVVVLSESLWGRHFAANPRVIGQTMRLGDEAYTIIGVMPASFRFPAASTSLWMPISYPPGDAMDTRSNHFVNVLGRLKSGVTVSQAQADLSVIATRIAERFPENDGWGVILARWQDSIVGDVRTTLFLLLGAVGFVLLIACTNVANLFLARATVRQKELTVRVALGAGRARLLGQLLAESMVLAAVGAVLGWGLASLVVWLLPFLPHAGIPRLEDVSLNSQVFAFTAALAVLVGLAFGLWPAWRATRADVIENLKDSARSMSAGRTHARVRSLLIVAEVTLALMLLVGAALLILSLARVQQVDPGFRPNGLLTMQVALAPAHYSSPARIVSFIDRALVAVSALPGVSTAGATTALPLVGGEWGKSLTIEGRPAPPSLAQVPGFNYRQVTAGYFSALGARLRQGRLFTLRDVAGQPGVAVVNEVIARRFWPDESPIGQRIRLGPPESLIAPLLPKDFPGGIEAWRASFPSLTIVGVVGNLRHSGLEQEVNPEIFVPIAQAAEETSNSFHVIARTAGDPLRYRSMIEAAIHGVDPNQPVADVQTMHVLLGNSLAHRRFTLLILGTFAGLALLLTLVGLYGVMAYTSSQRQNEIAIRAALGAQPLDLTGLIVGQGVRLAMVGIGVGLALAALLSRLVTSLLFQVEPIDLRLYTIVALLFLACAILACWIPSRRAIKRNPAHLLRQG